MYAYCGPAIVICYATCMAEDGVSEEKAMAQAKLAVESRTFPLLTYDPGAGAHMRERLSLRGNPALQENWYTPKAEGEPLDARLAREEPDTNADHGEREHDERDRYHHLRLPSSVP